MIWRFHDLLKIAPIFILLVLISCGNASEKKATESEEKKKNGTFLKLQGRWQEEADSLNILEFSKNEMIQFYGGSEINRYPVTIFNGFPGKGGYEYPAGRVIQIEESKDNFHHFKIVILDSNYLELEHRGSVQSKFYKRLKY